MNMDIYVCMEVHIYVDKYGYGLYICIYDPAEFLVKEKWTIKLMKLF